MLDNQDVKKHWESKTTEDIQKEVVPNNDFFYYQVGVDAFEELIRRSKLHDERMTESNTSDKKEGCERTE